MTPEDAIKRDDVMTLLSFASNFDDKIIVIHRDSGEIEATQIQSNKDGHLYAACYYDAYKCAKALLANNANPNIRATWRASYESTIGIVCYKNQNPKLLRMLFEYSADPDIVDSLGRTPLNILIRNFNSSISNVTKTRYLECVKILLENKANIYKLDQAKEYPLLLAKDSGDEELIALVSCYM